MHDDIDSNDRGLACEILGAIEGDDADSTETSEMDDIEVVRAAMRKAADALHALGFHHGNPVSKRAR